MNNLSSNLPGPIIPDPLNRNLQNGLLVTASSDLGKSAVTSQVGLVSEIDSIETTTQPNQVYQGVIEVNHDVSVTDISEDNSSESTEDQKPVERQVHNHYIEEPKPTLKELENQYPNESPLLASN